MGSSLNGVTQGFTRVYVIYSADVVGSAGDIKRMAPGFHMPAGYGNSSDPEYGFPMRQRMADAAARFTQTEGDSEYGFDYLAREVSDDAYLAAADRPEDYEGDGYQGRHRKWTAVLTRDEWELFARAYLIDLDEAGYPEDYEDTGGAVTEYGLLEAVSISNSEGWQDASGPQFVDSDIYVSFGSEPDPEPEQVTLKFPGFPPVKVSGPVITAVEAGPDPGPEPPVYY